MDKYPNRKVAGKILAKELQEYANCSDGIVLALPRGGVPVAYEIATALHVPLDVLIVRKLGVPGYSELAMGAIAMNDAIIFNEEIILQFQLSQTDIDAVIAEEKRELKRRELAYRGNKPFPVLKDKTIILVDDGIATGASMRVALQVLETFQPAKIIIAVPVAHKAMCENMQLLADDLICPMQPKYFNSVGEWYEDFSQTEDAEVHKLLKN